VLKSGLVVEMYCFSAEFAWNNVQVHWMSVSVYNSSYKLLQPV